jgi:hypothetical protein
MFSNQLGSKNTVVGSGALYHNVGGSLATAIGYHAMHNANDTNSIYANFAVAVGYNALRGSILPTSNTGNFNTAIGYNSQLSYSSGSRNTSVGHASLYSNTAGGDNTAVGHSALSENSEGNRNTAVGAQSFLSDTSFSNSTAVGYGAIIDVSNSVRLGDMSVTSIGGFADWTTVSDGRFKSNITESANGIDFVKLLRPVTYQLDMDAIAEFHHIPDSLRNETAEQLKGNQLQSGFIAQEVEIAAQSSGYDFSGLDAPSDPHAQYGLRYAQFVVPLVKAVQEQQQQIEILTGQVKELSDENAKLHFALDQINALKADLEYLKSTLNK